MVEESEREGEELVDRELKKVVAVKEVVVVASL